LALDAEDRSHASSLSYQWYKESSLIGTGPKLEISEAGNYILEMIDGTCSWYFPIRVDIENQAKFKDLEIFPNPILAGQQFNVRLLLPREEALQFSLRSIDGRVIYQQAVLQSDTHFFRIPVSKAGTYLLSLQTDQTSETRKIIVQ